VIGRTFRRLAMATTLILGLAGAARAGSQSVPLDKMFPFLQAYLELPPAERNLFALDYRLAGEAQALQSVRVALVDKGASAPIAIGADGKFGWLPSLQQFRDKAQVSIEAAKGVRLGLVMSVEPAVRPAQEIDAAELAASIVQAQAGERKVAGVLAFAAPKLTRIAFDGVKSGEAVGPDGRAQPLPLVKGRPVFDPVSLKGTKTVRFPAAPTRAELIGG
jgi:hypothetical protein